MLQMLQIHTKSLEIFICLTFTNINNLYVVLSKDFAFKCVNVVSHMPVNQNNVKISVQVHIRQVMPDKKSNSTLLVRFSCQGYEKKMFSV